MGKTKHIFYLLSPRFLGACFIFYLLSCQRQPDTLNPKISILLPSQNEIFAIPAEIPVEAFIEDDLNIESVEVYLTQDQVKSLSVPKFYYPNSKHFDLETKISIDNIAPIKVKKATYTIGPVSCNIF